MTDDCLPIALIDFPRPGRDGRWRWRFDHPVAWRVAREPHEAAAVLDDMHAMARARRWCVGWVAYEAASGLNPDLPERPLPAGQPYAVWAAFDQAMPWPDGGAVEDGGAWPQADWFSELDAPAMHDRVDQIRHLIRAGEVYQINLTDRLCAALHSGSRPLHACFEGLRQRQPLGYTGMLDARSVGASPGAVLSVSPELFFDWDGTHIVTRPMKGTAPRHADAGADGAAAASLRSSEKERAENLMIVDLLRNDLSRVAEVGSVKVPSLFDVEALPTVWQMTSTITARTRSAVMLSDVFAALFPCGSVTGAPKRQAMRHIAHLEASQRGVYCGAFGLMQPGGRVTLNVPIRTVCIEAPPASGPWHAACGVGSGITLDATPEGEWQEWQAKRRFLG